MTVVSRPFSFPASLIMSQSPGMHEKVRRRQGAALPVALALSTLVALACGGGEPLTYEESMELLESAAVRTVAGAFSLEDTNISIVETEDSPGEYIDTVFVLNYVPERGVFGYQGTFNPYAPPEKRNFLTTEDDRHFEYIESELCFTDNPSLMVDGDVAQNDLTYARFKTPQNFIGGKRVVEDGSIREIIEFEAGEGGTFSFIIEDGLLAEHVLHMEGDSFGRLVGAGFDGKIVAKKYVRMYYDIGVEKEFPAPEPICE